MTCLSKLQRLVAIPVNINALMPCVLCLYMIQPPPNFVPEVNATSQSKAQEIQNVRGLRQTT